MKRKSDITITLGLAMMRMDRTLTASKTRTIIAKEFGRKTIRQREQHIADLGGWNEAARKLTFER